MRPSHIRLALALGIALLAGTSASYAARPPSSSPVALASRGSTPRRSSPASAAIQRWRLPLAAHLDFQPAIAGNTAAYATTGCPAPCGMVLHLATLPTGQSRVVARLGRGISPLTIQLSATWLVWAEGHYPAPGWQIWAWNRRSGQRRLIDSSSTEGGPAAPNFPEISLSGHVLAWARHDCLQRCSRPGPSTVRTVNLNGGTAHVISRASYVCRQINSPSLSGSVLSWVGAPLTGYGCPAANTWTVFTRDRRTGRLASREIHLDRNQIAEEFVGSDEREAWVEHLEFTNRDDRVILMDLKSGTARVVANGGAYSPRLTGRILAWLGAYGGSIEALNLHTSRHYVLARTTSGSKQDTAPGTWLGVPWQNRVAWEEDSFNPDGGPIRNWLTVALVP